MRRSVVRARTVGVAAGVAAFAATAALAVTRTGHERPTLPLAPITAVGALQRALPPGPPGPEGVPIPAGPPLAPPRRLRRGEQIDGITCEAGEEVAFHVHAHLRIVVRGHSRRVPAGIGAAPPYGVAETPDGRFLAAAGCFTWLHTHAADGIIHVESPVERTYTLGQFFDIWGQPLDRRRLGPNRGRVTAFFDGRVYTGDPRGIPLLAHSRIELELGRALVEPAAVGWPDGL
jgi:hypothetical protein